MDEIKNPIIVNRMKKNQTKFKKILKGLEPLIIKNAENAIPTREKTKGTTKYIVKTVLIKGITSSTVVVESLASLIELFKVLAKS